MPCALEALVVVLYFLIMFYNWGEPLLNKQLPAFIRKAKARRIETDVNSNLSLHLSNDDIDELLGSGLDNLSASLDGFSQQSYETYRVGGDLELAKSNLERLVRAKTRLGLDTKISWNFLVFSFNEGEIPETRRYCQDLGIEFNPRDAYIDNPAWLPSYRSAEAAMREPPKWHTPIVWSPLAPSAERQHASGCGWHYGYSAVNADGSVSPCCASWNQKDDFGRLDPGVTSFGDIWNNDLYRHARRVFAGHDADGPAQPNNLCGQCPFGDGIQHLYSLLDVRVMMQFHRQFGREDGPLGQAFELLGRARYGASYHDLLREGQYLSPSVLASLVAAETANRPPSDLGRLLTGDERHTSQFVEFYEKNLAAPCPG